MILYFQNIIQILFKEIRPYLFWIVFLIVLGLAFGFVTAYIIEIKEGLII